MTTKELEKIAVNEVLAANPGSTDWEAKNTYENVMDGVLIEVQFTTKEGFRPAINHVHIRQGRMEVFRSFHEVCAAVAAHRDKSFFFRLLGFTGVGGLIALTLIGVFSILLSVIALTNSTPNEGVIEVIKLSFALILGYFFGSQGSRKRE
jgi:hypothetical protein